MLLVMSTEEPLNKGQFETSHFVLSGVKIKLLLWERGPELHNLLGGCYFLESPLSETIHLIKVHSRRFEG